MSTPPRAAAPKPPPSEGRGRTCACGHDKHHPMVSAEPLYSGIGWAAILTGISWEPKSVSYKCRVCDKVVDTVSDPAEMKKLRLYG